MTGRFDQPAEPRDVKVGHDRGRDLQLVARTQRTLEKQAIIIFKQLISLYDK
jgi:hypothetical protein